MREIDYFERAKEQAFRSLSEYQREIILQNLDKMKREDIASLVGIPITRLKRAAAFAGWKFSFTRGFADKKYDPGIVKKVTKYYEKHGKRKTQEKFPDVNVRAIVERYKGFSPRQSRWTEEEIMELVKFAGLINPSNQSRFFNRPRANEGSIVSVWQKRFNCKQTFLHGLPMYKAKIFLKEDVPTIKTQFKCGNGSGEIVLHCDAVKFIRSDCPDFVVEAIVAMAEFQLKLFGENPRLQIENIIEALK